MAKEARVLSELLPYLTDSDAWFLTDLPPECKEPSCLRCQLAKRLDNIENEAQAIREALYQLDHRRT